MLKKPLLLFFRGGKAEGVFCISFGGGIL